MQMPSIFRVSSAYSISRREPSTSGSGTVANIPNRPGLSAITFAPNSLVSRASLRAESKFPKKTLGSLMDNIEVATPPRSMSSIDWATVHFINGTWPVLRPAISAMNPGDERW